MVVMSFRLYLINNYYLFRIFVESANFITNILSSDYVYSSPSISDSSGCDYSSPTFKLPSKAMVTALQHLAFSGYDYSAPSFSFNLRLWPQHSNTQIRPPALTLLALVHQSASLHDTQAHTMATATALDHLPSSSRSG